MDGDRAHRIVDDEARLRQLADDDPGITPWQMLRRTLPLIRGLRGKLRALGIVLLRALP